ncbi:MAG: hypothetical protein H7Y11_01600, partial [Armatimonadetes bacterium]|nr:hypothetical protein [Anaerolineae bacterium]
GALVFIDQQVQTVPLYQRIIAWLVSHKAQAIVVMRVGMGMTLLFAWQSDRLLAPDLVAPSALVGWLQFGVALLLLLPITTPLAGVGVLGLYVIGIANFGAFYMLDYFAFVGIGVYLMGAQAGNDRIRGLRLPALYFSVGFSLMWLGLEKIIYPQWGVYILQQNPQLTLGLDVNLFLLIAAFVELALGYLLIICLLERPLALVVTLVFFTTTLVFGKVEIIGHTILHAALIVFLLEGPGNIYPTPINIHKRLPLRMAFSAVNFVLLLFILLAAYSGVAQLAYQQNTQTAVIEAPPPLASR